MYSLMQVFQVCISLGLTFCVILSPQDSSMAEVLGAITLGVYFGSTFWDHHSYMKGKSYKAVSKDIDAFSIEECVFFFFKWFYSNSKILWFLIISAMAFCFPIHHKNKLAYESKEHRNSQSYLKYAKEGLTYIVIRLHIHVLRVPLREVCGMIIIL